MVLLTSSGPLLPSLFFSIPEGRRRALMRLIMGVEPGADKAEVQGLRVRAVIVLSNCLLAVGLLSAGRLSSSCVAGSLSCVVGVALSLAHSCGGCGTAVCVHACDAPLLPMRVIKGTAGGQKTTQQQLSYKFHPN